MCVLLPMLPALRSLRKNLVFAFTIVVLLGFGVGANTALFTLFRAILLRPVPGVKDPGELVRIRRTQYGRVQGNQSYPDYLDFRDTSKTVTGLVAGRLIPILLPGPPARIANGAIVTGNYFVSLGVKAAAGRLLDPDDDRGEHAVVVVSERFWKRELGGDIRAIGVTLRLNGFPFTVVGVAAAPFEGVEFGEHSDLWMPMSMVHRAMTRNPQHPWLALREAGWLTWYGRLRPGMGLGAAQREWDVIADIADRLAAAYPGTNRGRRFEIDANAAMAPNQRAEIRSLLGLLFVAIGLILAIACGNVANLMLARAAGRSREMAVRLALGASRWTLLRHVLQETLVLAPASGAVALLLAPWMSGLLGRVWQQEIPDTPALDGRVLAFSVAASLGCLLLCALAPAWAASSTDVAGAMKQTPAASGLARGRVQRAFAIAQIAFSAALVIACGLVLDSLRRIAAIQPGFRPDGVVMATMDLSLLGMSPETGTEIFQSLVRHVSAMPGVRSVSLGKSSPAVDWSDRVELAGFPTDRNIVAPGYFRTLGIRLVAGRDFTDADRAGTAPVAIVSQSLAARLWKDGHVIGRMVRTPARPLGSRRCKSSAWLRIRGTARY